MVLLLPYKTSCESLMRMAGHCCTTVLEPHKEVDILSSFVIVSEGVYETLIAVEISSISSKVMQLLQKYVDVKTQ